jgi:multicomponent Na+:H+ antiporter subunit D
MNIHQSPLPVLIIVAPLLTSFVIPVLGMWKRAAVYPLTVLALSFSFVTSVMVATEVSSMGPVEYFLGGWAPPWGIAYRVDHLGAMMLVLLTSITLLVAVYSKNSIVAEAPTKEVPFYSVFLLLVCGLTGIVATADMFNLYVFLEITSLTGYALISIGERAAVVSAFRYVIIGTVGACFYLLSVGYLYSVTGSLNMADLSRILPGLYHSRVVLVAFAFFISGISIKMALFPMHSWLPGAYADAPSTVSALLAATTTKVGVYVMVRVMFFVFEPRFSIELIPVTTLLSWMGAVAMILGSVVAIAQTDIKRMLAYSSVAQIGYIVLGIGIANRMGMTGGLLHIVNHAFMKGCLFLVAGAIAYRTGLRRISDFRNLSRRMPWTSATFAIAAFSMIGIPPTCGFFSKLYLILGAIDAGEWAFVGLILFSSTLALAYFGNVIRYMYLPNAEPVPEGAMGTSLPEPVRKEAPLGMLIPMLVFAAAILLLGLFNGQVISRFVDPAITEVFGG